MLLGFRRIVSVQGLRIDDNEIRRCLSRPVASAGERSIETMGFGGISLADADGLTIRKNVIEDNGPDYLDPVCGIFMLHGEGVEIADNRIVNNGSPTSDPPANARPGRGWRRPTAPSPSTATRSRASAWYPGRSHCGAGCLGPP